MVDRERYARQGLMPELPPEAQERLRANRVLVLGAGGLGAPILYYLTAVGVGSIRLVDDDVVSVSNLNRQILFAESDLGKPKAECARTRLLSFNSTTHIDAHAVRLTADNAHALASDVDLIIDASDNLATRYLLDDVAGALGTPYLYGAVEGFVGQCALFHFDGCGSYRGLFPEMDAKADATPVGIVGATAGALGSMMASEAIRLLAGLTPTLAGTLLRLDLSAMRLDRFSL